MRLHSLLLATPAILACVSAPIAAQTQVEAAVGATWLYFGNGWGGGSGGLAAEVRANRQLSAAWSAGLEVLAIMPVGVVNAVAGCVPNTPCISRQTPTAIWGGIGSMSRRLASGFRGSIGIGVIAASGMQGPGSSNSSAVSLGLTWSSQRPRIAPVLGVRGVGLASSIAGLRYMMLPTIGLRF
jgi:hypothetical protein